MLELVALLALSSASLSNDPSPDPASSVGEASTLEVGAMARVVGLRCVDLDGGVHRLGLGTGIATESRALSLVFLDPGCPIAQKMGPRLNELADEAAERGVTFLGVLSDPALGRGAARTFRDEAELRFPVLLDVTGELAARLAPTHVPEAFVVDETDRLLYRGRIDNRFEAVGKQRAQVTSNDLQDALRGVAAGTLEPRATEPVGCVFEAWDGDVEQEITYTQHVAPILAANCVDCHRTGDVGPMVLDDYESVKRRAKMVAQVTRSRSMPPWFAETEAGHFRDERKLSRREIAMLETWAKSGAPEGDPADRLPARDYESTRWRLGTPDLLIEMPESYDVPAGGDDIYRYFVIPNEELEGRHITAIDFRPGDPSVVHHCIAYHDLTGVAALIDEHTPEPGFAAFGRDRGPNGERFDPSGLNTTTQIAGWAPGTQPYVLPAGVGQPLQGGGHFVLEIHYHPTGQAATDRSALALYLADEGEPAIEREAAGLVIGTQNVEIEPGDDYYMRHVWMEVPADMDVIDVSPHMHYLGKEVEVVATLPDGDEKPLIRIEDWDFRWQGAYFYTAPVTLPAGSRIDAYFRFDNSADNPFNPSNPPIRVSEGWRTTDEMCLFYFTVVPHAQEDIDSIYGAMFQSFRRSGAPE